jgi:hypothetical protein
MKTYLRFIADRLRVMEMGGCSASQDIKRAQKALDNAQALEQVLERICVGLPTVQIHNSGSGDACVSFEPSDCYHDGRGGHCPVVRPSDPIVDLTVHKDGKENMRVVALMLPTHFDPGGYGWEAVPGEDAWDLKWRREVILPFKQEWWDVVVDFHQLVEVAEKQEGAWWNVVYYPFFWAPHNLTNKQFYREEYARKFYNLCLQLDIKAEIKKG